MIDDGKTATTGIKRLMIHHRKAPGDVTTPTTNLGGETIPETETTETHAEIATEIQSPKRRRSRKSFLS
jgi:hypothetical protein